MITKKYINDLSYKIIGAAIEVHKQLGPGLLESVYQQCLIEELKELQLKVEVQKLVPIYYKGKLLSENLRLDLLIEKLVIVELKAIEFVLPVHKAQLLSYMKLSEKPKGLLINFHTDNIIKSMTPLVNELFAALPE
jgi:GxxExxY protein